MEHSRWDHRYLELALHIDRHVPGLVDSYYGPPEIEMLVQKSPALSTAELLQAVCQLQECLDDISDEHRRRFLHHQLAGLEIVVRKLHGEKVSFEEEVRGCYDVEPQALDMKRVQEVHDSIQRSLGCRMDELRAELARWRNSHVVARRSIRSQWEAIAREARERTQARLPLPKGEEIELRLVKRRPYSGYNWYLGDYRSRVDLNTDLRVYSCFLPGIVMHESYPGHHTERCLKERALVKERDYAEASVVLYSTPECVISEGIGKCAKLIAFSSQEELLEWCNQTLRTSFDVERDARILRGVEELDLRGNAAIMLLRDRVGRDEVEKFIMEQGLRTRREAAKTVDFAEKYGPYAIAYWSGALVVRRAIDPSSKIELSDLYTSQLTPSMLSERLE